jgi:uncharacterized protein with HEPN domain
VKDPRVYLIHIEESLTNILTFTEGGREAFAHDLKTQNAVIRCFEVIGEATKRLPPELTQASPDVPWRKMAGFRDILSHAYDRVDLDEVWNVVEQIVPGLLTRIAQIRRMIDETGRAS